MGFEKFLRFIGWPMKVGASSNGKGLPKAPEGEIEPEELRIARNRSNAIEEKTKRCETEITTQMAAEESAAE